MAAVAWLAGAAGCGASHIVTRVVGVGSGFYVAPNQVTAEGHRAAAVIVAFKLGSCHSRPAYDAVQWYFPEYGEHFKPDQTGYKLCTGL
jgi:hypothetical protein